MKIHRITDPPTPEMARKLAEFEKEFVYPLGSSDSFTISHGEDYPLFFRGMGNARIHLAETSGVIVGAQAVVERNVSLADGTEIPAAYFCDTKVVSQMRGGMVLGRLAIAACKETLAAGIHSGFSVVMDGSKTTDQHTGRLGIPQFEELARLVILRFDTAADFKGFPDIQNFHIQKCHRPHGGNPALCSEMKPLELNVDGASGLLLDTRLGKRLWKSDGTEMISAHLTSLRFSSAHSLSKLIHTAIEAAAGMGIPGLFLALPEALFTAETLRDVTSGCATGASARVYGTGLPKGDWIVDTSEI
jgi:hypothetical protein